MRALSIALTLLSLNGGAFAQDRTPVILIVGDSWAASITAENRDGFPSPDVFDDVLVANGFGEYETLGDKTAWGGRKASDWAKAGALGGDSRAIGCKSYD